MNAGPTNDDEFAALQNVISALRDVDADARARIVEAATTFLEIGPRRGPASRDADEPLPSGSSQAPYPSFSADVSVSPKEFLFEKQPRTDVERLAALAYYLTHYRDTPQFKTLDLSKLNTEAAQPKFANAAASANNAVKQGYLVPTTKGLRQLSAAGERFIVALPDREAARAALSAGVVKRKSRKSTAKRPRSPAA
jgi:hypothetical protein